MPQADTLLTVETCLRDALSFFDDGDIKSQILQPLQVVQMKQLFIQFSGNTIEAFSFEDKTELDDQKTVSIVLEGPCDVTIYVLEQSMSQSFDSLFIAD